MMSVSYANTKKSIPKKYFLKKKISTPNEMLITVLTLTPTLVEPACVLLLHGGCSP